jgi:hypothetical protein
MTSLEASTSVSLLALLSLLLFLVLLIAGSGLLLLVVAELLNKESAHDSILDLSGGKDTTIGS